MTSDSRPLQHPAWARSASIYQVNIRQYTPEGTFAALEAHLPRVKKMGVDILWLMPIQPIGVQNRKGTLGSNYSVSDYLSVNAEFGTLEEFKQLVRRTHQLGMYLILDWVANHTAWDHAWVQTHPDWYKKDAQGAIHSYVYDNGRELEYWTDVVGLDFQHSAVAPAMLAALEYWVRETDIDGYRCDVAGLVPTPFWESVRRALDHIKPVFMLAEWSDPELHRAAFDMTYDWALYDAMARIAAGRGDSSDLVRYLEQSQREYPKDAYRMLFTSNHDKNAWEASDTERFGASFRAFAVLAATLPGMPLIYGGQESVLDKRLAFFEKDPIAWKTHELGEFYAGLFHLKKRNSALWNGEAGGAIEVLPLGDAAVFGFLRSDATNRVTVVVNLSDRPRSVRGDAHALRFELEPWGYRVIEG